MSEKKSLITNLMTLGLIITGYLIPVHGELFKVTGYFALSGAITNWIAIYMLFERVPGFYGSGVIPLRFNEFKAGIKQLIMGQFFTTENLNHFFQSENKDNLIAEFIEKIDFEKIYAGLIDEILKSPLGSMLMIVGGAEALKPLKTPLIQRMQQMVTELGENHTLFNENHTALIYAKIEAIVDTRLNELSPQMVKIIIQDMIRHHLGWLVVWGGVFGGFIGLIMHGCTFL
jgi:uncharacterized membrane protein YheB (UPF0754 family)